MLLTIKDEAFGIGDLVGYVADGCLKRIDTPDEFYRHPHFKLAKFLGYGHFPEQYCSFLYGCVYLS